jgi:hypothetical protein
MPRWDLCVATLLLALLALLTPLGCGARSSPIADDAGSNARRDGGATFTCQPQPSAARGCPAPDTTWGKAGQPGVTYPVGCKVVYPFPHPFYPSGPATCSCEESPFGTQPGWTCPL